MNNTEVCVNLWYCVDGKTGLVNAIAGRGYHLSGNDVQKDAILKSLAATDFCTVEWLALPEQFCTQQLENQKGFSGAMPAAEFEQRGLEVFESVFEQIESLEQAYSLIENAVEFFIPDEPLYVMTPIINNEGLLEAVVVDE